MEEPYLILMCAGCRQWWWMAVVDWRNWLQRSQTQRHSICHQRQDVRAEAKVKAGQLIGPSSWCCCRRSVKTETSAANPLQHFDIEMVQFFTRSHY